MIKILAVVLLCVCNTAFSADLNYEKTYSKDENLKFLSSIPLIQGLEKPGSDEPQITEELVRLFTLNADTNKNQDGTLNRGTHAKGTCFQGQVHIFSAKELMSDFKTTAILANRIKQGVFSQSGDRPATMRFANADGFGRIQSDTVDDVRGFSFSMDGGVKDYAGTYRQDFMFNSAPAFITAGIKEFSELVKFGNLTMKHAQGYSPQLSDLPNPLYLAALIKDLSDPTLGNLTGHNTKSFATQEYWADLPYTHGMDSNHHLIDLVKYKATPCDGKGTQKLSSTAGLDDTYLQDDISQRAKDGKVCLLIQVQFFDIDALRSSLTLTDPKADWSVSDWIENGGAVWDESVLPFHTVAKIEIPLQKNPGLACEGLYINTRLHSNVENQPVGSVARVRPIVEEISRYRRMGGQ